MASATVPPDKTIFDLDVDAVKKVTELNLFGTILPTMVFAKSMVESGKGSIINFASESALRPLTRVAGYGVAKAAVANWTKYLCAELAIKFGEGHEGQCDRPRVPSDEPEPRTSHQRRRLPYRPFPHDPRPHTYRPFPRT